MTANPPVRGQRCALCSRPAVNFHHVVGALLDPVFGVPLCHNCHSRVDDDWNTTRLNAKAVPDNRLELLEWRLRRAAMFFGVAAVAWPSDPMRVLLAAAAGGLALWAFELRRDMAKLDAEQPGWRGTLAFS